LQLAWSIGMMVFPFSALRNGDWGRINTYLPFRFTAADNNASVS
jgi:hypothetical protein